MRASQLPEILCSIPAPRVQPVKILEADPFSLKLQKPNAMQADESSMLCQATPPVAKTSVVGMTSEPKRPRKLPSQFSLTVAFGGPTQSPPQAGVDITVPGAGLTDFALG